MTAPSLAHRAVRRLKRLAKGLLGLPATPPEPKNRHLWSIGIYAGTSPLALGPSAAIPNPAFTRSHVTDIKASFVADPFLIRSGGTIYLFFEALNLATRRGEIGVASSADGAAWRYHQIVLREPFHLSYPQVIEWQGEHYLIPESNETGTVRLYQAVEFPSKWRLVHTLISGERFSDATLLRHDEKWWIFADVSQPLKHDTLRLYSADDLRGTWTEHPMSPLIAGDRQIARPAGRVLRHRDRLYRFAQDCEPHYGMRVRAFEIDELTATSYREHPVELGTALTGSGQGWNAEGMHHLDALPLGEDRWIGAVDGWCWATKSDVQRTREP